MAGNTLFGRASAFETSERLEKTGEGSNSKEVSIQFKTSGNIYGFGGKKNDHV
ncbi:MAG: hypothetical protein K2H40_09970 [Lachnospiraceae bacterium]|nr:hypothetical protein [Lachnospiraceae bacterium]